jgi:hypothetical protein
MAETEVIATPEVTDNILKTIEAREGELKTTTWPRYDADRDLILEPYRWKMPDKFGVIKDVAGASNITLNLAKIYLFKTNAIMVASEMVFQVKGVDKSGKELSDAAKGKIVDFCKRLLNMADRRLTNRGDWPLKPWWVEQINWRGGVSARCCLTVDGEGNLKVNITPWDVRFVSYEFNDDGIDWGAYLTGRTPAQIKYEYPTTSGEYKSNVNVRDFWNKNLNVVYGEKNIFKTRKNPYGKPPVILKFCQSGTMLQDVSTNVQKARGESIFALDRDLYPVANETASMLQSMSIRSYKPALTYQSADGMVLPEESPWTPGSVTGVKEGEKLDKVPTDDIKLATSLMQKWLMECIEMGSLSSLDMGNLAFPESSFVIQKLIDNRNQILVPRLHTLEEAYGDLCRMAIDQYLILQEDAKLGVSGDMKQFKPSDLEGDYDVVCELHAVYPEQNIADLSLANAQLGFFTKPWIMENTFKQKDPTNMIREKDIENAESSIPAFAYARLALQLMEEGKVADAKLLAKLANATLKAMISGDFDPNKLNNVRPPVQNDNLTALMAGQNTGTTTKNKAQTNRTRQKSVELGANQ